MAQFKSDIRTSQDKSGKVYVESSDYTKIVQHMERNCYTDFLMSGGGGGGDGAQSIRVHRAVLAASAPPLAEWLTNHPHVRTGYGSVDDTEHELRMDDISHTELQKFKRKLYSSDNAGKMLANMYASKLFVDVELNGIKSPAGLRNSRSIKAHATVMAASSPFLDSRINETIYDVSSSGVNLTNDGMYKIELKIGHDALFVIVEYIYTGCLTIDARENSALLAECVFAAEYLELNELAAALKTL